MKSSQNKSENDNSNTMTETSINKENLQKISEESTGRQFAVNNHQSQQDHKTVEKETENTLRIKKLRMSVTQQDQLHNIQMSIEEVELGEVAEEQRISDLKKKLIGWKFHLDETKIRIAHLELQAAEMKLDAERNSQDSEKLSLGNPLETDEFFD